LRLVLSRVCVSSFIMVPGDFWFFMEVVDLEAVA
jgi:hypothetical protein